MWSYRELLYAYGQGCQSAVQTDRARFYLGNPPAGYDDGSLFDFFGALGKIPSDGHPYPIFVYGRTAAWTFFANSITNSASSLVGSANLVSKVYFPRLIIPLSSVGSGLVDFAIAAVVLLLLMVF